MDHEYLVNLAAMWLRPRCSIVLTELRGQNEIPDAIGWNRDHTILIECKTSKSDFRADAKKRFRTYGGMGYSRYYLAPAGLLGTDDLPSGWGLLESDGGGVEVCRRSIPFPDRNLKAETRLLVSTIRRVGQNPEPGMAVHTYKYPVKHKSSVGVEDMGLFESACSQWLWYATAYFKACFPECWEDHVKQIKSEIRALRIYDTPFPELELPEK